MRLEDGAELAELELRGEVLAGRRARGVRLRDCSLHGCDLAGLRATEASLVRTTLADCRLTGADPAGAALQDVEVRDCRGDLLGLRQARTRRVTFSGCVLVDAELDGARLDQVVFDGCDLTGASFAGASCRAVELRGCTLDGLRGVDGLRGAALEWDALLALVPALAAALGLRVLDAEDQRRPAPRPLHGAPPSGEMCRDAAPRRPRRPRCARPRGAPRDGRARAHRAGGARRRAPGAHRGPRDDGPGAPAVLRA